MLLITERLEVSMPHLCRTGHLTILVKLGNLKSKNPAEIETKTLEGA